MRPFFYGLGTNEFTTEINRQPSIKAYPRRNKEKGWESFVRGLGGFITAGWIARLLAASFARTFPSSTPHLSLRYPGTLEDLKVVGFRV